MYFTNFIKDDLHRWVRDNLHIPGMDKLYEQITRDGKANHDLDKDGFFFQAQVTRQLAESKKYDITKVEDKGITHDIDIELDGYICLQVWFGGNVVGHDLNRKVKRSNLPLVTYSHETCLDKDSKVLEHKLNQINKPTTGGGVECPVKILVAMSRTLLPLHFLPEWGRLFRDRVVIELRGGFDRTGNIRGWATLRRLSKRWDGVATGIVGALGFRYVKSFSLGAGRPSMHLGGLSNSVWHGSYLHTASQYIPLRPKVMASVMDSNIVAGYLMDTTGHEPSPEHVNGYLGEELQLGLNRVIWADVERPDLSAVPILGKYHMESLDRIIADRNLVKNSRPGRYNLYGGKINRDKTDAFDSAVVDAGNADLEIAHVEGLLHGIRIQSNKTPDCFFGDPIAIMEMLELGCACGCLGMTRTAPGNYGVWLNSFMGIPVLHRLGSGPSKPGCIYAISYKDELGVPSGLRLLGSSFHVAKACKNTYSDGRIAYVIGETAVDPRACGKIMNIRGRLR